MRRFGEILNSNLFAFDEPERRTEVLRFRILEIFVVAWTIQMCWVWGAYIQSIGEVVLPLGIAQYVDVSFMFDHGVSLVNAALVTTAGLLGLARKGRWWYSVAILLFHLQYVSRYCLGEISHGSNLVGMSLFLLAVSRVAFRDPVEFRRFAVGSMYFFIGLGYTSAAMSKLLGTGIRWPRGEHLWMWISERQTDLISRTAEFTPNLLQEMIIGDASIGTLILTFGLLVELFGFLMWFRKTRYFIIPTIITMHFGIAMTMNIRFDLYVMQLIILGIPVEAIHRRFVAGRSSSTFRAEPTGEPA